MQLSPIQCTYSNIFTRFFKFSPANTNIYQNSYRVTGANCAVEIALSGRQCSLLCLFAPFPHGYTVSRGVPDNCTFEIALSQAITLTLLFVCAFSPKVQSIFWGSQFAPQNDKVLRTEWKPLQKRLKCLCGSQNKPNKHYTVLKLIIFIHTQLNSGRRTISP